MTLNILWCRYLRIAYTVLFNVDDRTTIAVSLTVSVTVFLIVIVAFVVCKRRKQITNRQQYSTVPAQLYATGLYTPADCKQGPSVCVYPGPFTSEWSRSAPLRCAVSNNSFYLVPNSVKFKGQDCPVASNEEAFTGDGVEKA